MSRDSGCGQLYRVVIAILTTAVVVSQPVAVVSVTADETASLTVDVRIDGEQADEVNALLIYQDRDWSEPYREIENYESVDLEHVFSNLPGGHEYLVSAYIQDQPAGNTGWINLDDGDSVEREIDAEERHSLTVRALHDDGSTPLEDARMTIESHESYEWREGTTGGGGYAHTPDGGDDFYLYPPGDADDSSYYTVEIHHDGEVVGSQRIDSLDSGDSIEVETSVPVTYDLSVSSTDGGYVDADRTGSIEAGTEVDLEANDDGDHAFDEWDGDVPAGVSESDDDITVTMDQDRKLEAEFAEEGEVSFEVMKASTIDGYEFSGEPIEDARLTIDGVTRESDDKGDVSFSELAPGTYSYTARATGYETVSGSFELAGGEFLTVPVSLPRTGVGGLTVNVVDRDGNEVAANKYRVLADGERLQLNQDGGVLLDEGTYDITVKPTDFGSGELTEMSKIVTVEAGEDTSVTLTPTQPRKPPIQNVEVDVLKINGNAEDSDGYRVDGNIDSIQLKVTDGEGQPVTTPTLNLRLEGEPENVVGSINHQGNGVYTADIVPITRKTQYLQVFISYNPSSDEASTAVPIMNDFDPLIKPIPGWVPYSDGVTVSVDGQQYTALLMKRDGEYERDISGKEEKAWIVFDSKGRIVQNSEVRRKAALTAMVTWDTRPDGSEDVQELREELPSALKLALTLGPTIEGTVIARDVLSQLLGAVIGAVATGGGNLAAQGGTKIAAKSTLKGATKETAKQFATKFVEDYAKSQLSKVKLNTGNPDQLIEKGIRSESRKEIKEARSSSKTAGKILSNHIDGEQWSYTEAKRYRTAYVDLSTDGYYYLNLYANSYDQDVQTQLKQVTFNVVEGGTGAPVTTLTGMIEDGKLGYISKTNNQTSRHLAFERLRNRSYKEYSQEAQQQAIDSYGDQALYTSKKTGTTPASISISTEPSETYVRGEEVTTTVKLTNTGDRTKRFFVGYSVRTTVDGESKYFDNADSTGRFVTVAAGESAYVPVNWTAQSNAPVGKEYDVLVAVWPTFPDPDVQPLDRAEQPNAFTLNIGANIRGTSINPTSGDQYVNESINIVATVSNEGPSASTRVVNLTVGETTVDNQIATIPSKRTERVTFTHTFDEPGQYVLKVAGHEKRITVLERNDSDPIARPIVVRSVAGDLLIFDGGKSTGTAAPISTYEWDFDGDGTIDRTTTESTTTHTYTEPGQYMPKLTVTDEDGNTDTATTTVTVDADETNTVALLDFQPENPEIGQSVSFDASNSTTAANIIEEYRWDFDGDSNIDRTTTDPTTTYAYANSGRRSVKLTIVDDAGNQASSTWAIQVGEGKEEDPDETLLEADFESTPVGQYPSEWTKAGNRNQEVVDSPAASGDRALQLSGSHGGCWEAIADRETELPNSGTAEISFSIRPTTNGQVGCHDNNGAVKLNTETGSWSAGSGYGLVEFTPDGTVSGSGTDLGSYQIDAWNDITIRYARSGDEVTLTYFVNGERRGTTTRDARSFEDALSYLRVKSGDFTTQIDDVEIERVDDDPPDVGTPTAERRDFTGDGTEDIRISNGEVFLQIAGENVSGGRQVADIIGRDGNRQVLDRTSALPNNPYSTGKDRPTYESTSEFKIIAETDRLASYRVVRNYSYEHTGARVQIAWQATVFADGEYALTQLNITNIDKKPVELDQDDGDIHDGIQLFHSLRLAGRDGSNSAYRFQISDQSPQQFSQTGRWTTFGGTEHGTIFDGQNAATVRFLTGETSPNQWITDGDGQIGYHVGETVVDPGETISWTAALAVHEGGQDAPTEGEALVADADERVDEIPSGSSASDKGPVAEFDIAPSSPTAGVSITFDASGASDADGTIETYNWDFNGDGTIDETTTAPTVSHTYAEPGQYDVELTVVDDEGKRSTTNRVVKVTQQNAAATQIITAVDSQADTSPGTAVRLSYTVTNPTDEAESILVEYPDLPANTSLIDVLGDINQDLSDANPPAIITDPVPAGENATVSIVLLTAENAAAGTYPVTAEAIIKTGSDDITNATTTTEISIRQQNSLVTRFSGSDETIGNLDVLRAVNAANTGRSIEGEPVTNLDVLRLVNHVNQ